MTGSKKFHNKSRNGCGQCKRRRVKCDLRPPICSNCWKRDETCDYQLQQGMTSSEVNRASAVSNGGRNELQINQQPHNPLLDTFLSAELTSHYLACTSLKFAPAADLDPRWGREIMSISSSYPFLRHALLAISGLHICHGDLVGSGIYYRAACYHAVKASTLFRSTVTNLNSSNWTPVSEFIIASVFFNYDISFLSSSFNTLSCPVSLSSILGILRAPRSLGSQVHSLMHAHPRAENLMMRIRGRRLPIDEKPVAAIRKLLAFCKDESVISGSMVLQTTAQQLRNWADFVSCQPEMWVHFFSWPAGLPEEYISMLESGHDVANLIFVYWCAIMSRAPNLYYLRGTMNILADLAISHLGSRLNELLEWPLEELQRNSRVVHE